MRNLNETVIKFYDSISDQMRYDEALPNFTDKECGVISAVNLFVPFILKRTHGANTGAITSIANIGGANYTVTAAGHIVQEGKNVTISGTTNFNGIYVATNITATTFDIVEAAVPVDETSGTWTTGKDNVIFEVFTDGDVLAYTYLHTTLKQDVSATDYDYLYYDASGTFTVDMDPGKYYIKIQGWDISTWYSEMIAIINSVDLAKCVRIDFSADVRIGRLKAGFEQKVYINSRFRAPEYPREDVGDKKDGLIILEKQIYQKLHRVYFLAHESLVDALILLPMYDSYTVRRANGDFISVQELQVEDPVWQEDSRGTLADMHVTIIEETFIKKKTFTPMECPTYIIRSGTFTTTAGVAEQVDFASSMTDATYAIFITCWETARPTQNADWSFDEALAIDKFVIKTLVNATGRYVAISI